MSFHQDVGTRQLLLAGIFSVVVTVSVVQNDDRGRELALLKHVFWYIRHPAGLEVD
jgi:hypothetical protein